MDFVQLLTVRYFTEVLGMRYLKTEGNAAWFEEGLNKVVVGFYFSEIYEEGELYKAVGVLLSQNAAKTYLVVFPEALPHVDSRYFKTSGVGLVVVDPTKVDKAEVDKAVEVKIYAKPRYTTELNLGTLESVKSDIAKYIETEMKKLHEQISLELKKIENTLYEKLRVYIDQKIERSKLEARGGGESGREDGDRQRGGILDNEWVRILRSKS